VKQDYWFILLFLWIGVTNLSAESLQKTASPNALGFKNPSQETLFLLDQFEDGDYIKNPKWWVFGPVKLSIGYNTWSSDTPFVEKRSMIFQGEGSRYIGGIGMYLPKDLSAFDGMRLVLWGNGADSGHVQLQLFDDDNGNFVIETFEDLPNKPSRDDKWLHTLRIDWTGWREILIPFSEFHDANPGIGDDIWNPFQEKESGGFLQIQLVALSATDEAPIFFKLDNIGFISGYKFPKDVLPSGDILDEPAFHENIDQVTTPASADSF
jgi:hypothetical protein